MKKIAVITLATALLSACSTLPTTFSKTTTTTAKSVAGTYQGELPCADCEKIQAKLVINADDTYQYDTVYFKNSQAFPYSEKGKLTWDKNKSDVIRLSAESGNLALKLSDNYAELCDPTGEPVKSSPLNYKLLKSK